MHNVFVYGTLRGSKPKATPAWLGGFNMYDYGKFPYVYPSADEDDMVYGELIEVTNKELAALDKYEGISRGLYTRREVKVMPKDGNMELVSAWVYVGESIHPKPIPSGDWITHSKGVK